LIQIPQYKAQFEEIRNSREKLPDEEIPEVELTRGNSYPSINLSLIPEEVEAPMLHPCETLIFQASKVFLPHPHPNLLVLYPTHFLSNLIIFLFDLLICFPLLWFSIPWFGLLVRFFR